jgi:hypothetical protein
MPTRWRHLLIAALGALALGLLLAACGGDDDDEKAAAVRGNYAGEVSGTGAYIGLVSNGSKLLGYVCDGKQVSAWLEGPVTDGKTELTTRAGEAVGEVNFTASKASGEITVPGASGTFTAELGTGKGGLYRTAEGEPGEPVATETGWVVLNDGSIKGLKSAGGTLRSAPSSPTGYIDPNNI